MHHRLLLGSTALVGAGFLLGAAGQANAAEFEVALTGYTEFGVSAAEKNLLTGSDRGYGLFMDTEIIPTVTATADNGVQYGGKVELEVFTSNTSPNDPGVTADEANIFFSGGFGRFELGRDDGPEDVMFVGGEDVQAGTGGIDGDTANLDLAHVNDSGDAAKVAYFTPRVGGFQLGVGFTPDEADDFGDDSGADFANSWGFGANWTGDAAGLDLTLAATGIWAENDSAAVDDKADYQIGLTTEFGGLAFGAGWVQGLDFDERIGVQLGLGYGFGPVNTSVGWSWVDPDEGDDNNVFAVSADVGLLPGVVAKGDVTYATDTVGGTADGDDTFAGVATIQLNY